MTDAQTAWAVWDATAPDYLKVLLDAALTYLQSTESSPDRIPRHHPGYQWAVPTLEENLPPLAFLDLIKFQPAEELWGKGLDEEPGNLEHHATLWPAKIPQFSPIPVGPSMGFGGSDDYEITQDYIKAENLPTAMGFDLTVSGVQDEAKREQIRHYLSAILGCRIDFPTDTQHILSLNPYHPISRQDNPLCRQPGEYIKQYLVRENMHGPSEFYRGASLNWLYRAGFRTAVSTVTPLVYVKSELFPPFLPGDQRWVRLLEWGFARHPAISFVDTRVLRFVKTSKSKREAK